MFENQPSQTAYRVAMRRAAHQLLDSPIVFEDPLAVQILGHERAAAIRQDPHRFERGVLAPYLRAFLAVRSCVAEETLANSVAAGISQYVILGAGLDTFAYRSRHPLLRIFEVDHPATQAWKRECLQEAGIPLPKDLTFVPVDFEQQDLSQELQKAGLRTESGTFFSWLGVTPYLESESVQTTLKAISGLTRRGGGVVFDYAVPASSLGLMQRAAFELMAARVKAAGEPWRTFFTTDELSRYLNDLGFQHIENLNGDQLNQRYFAGRSDGLKVGSLGHIMKAMVSNSSTHI